MNMKVCVTSIAAAAAMLLSVSCSGPKYRAPEFPVECECRWEIISGELYFNLVNDIFEYDTCFVVPSYDLKTHNTLHIYSRNSGEKIYTGIYSGRGDGETIYGYRMASLKNGVLSYVSMISGDVLSVPIESLLDTVLKPDFRSVSIRLPEWCQYAVPMDDGYFYVTNVGHLSDDTVSRFIMEKDGMVTAELNYFPIEDKAKSFTMYNFSSYAVSPDRTKFVIGTPFGAIMEIYSLDSTIEHKATKYFYEPDFEVTFGSYDYTKGTVLGFHDIYVTDDWIYGVYDGERNPYYAGDERLVDTKIAVFDWDGNPKELIRTDYGIDRICYSERENALYGAVRDIDDIMYLARLDLNRLD